MHFTDADGNISLGETVAQARCKGSTSNRSKLRYKFSAKVAKVRNKKGAKILLALARTSSHVHVTHW